MRKTIRSTMSHQAERPSIAPNAVDYQGLLHYQLMGLMRMLLKTSALQSVHSSMASTQQLEKQASACVEEELKSYLHKLESMPNNNNRESNLVTAYALLSSNVLSDIEHQLVQGHLKEVHQLRDLNQDLKNDYEALKDISSMSVAQRDQDLYKLKNDIKILEYKNDSLIKVVDTLNKELQKSNRSLVDAQQKNVELCLQCAEYKADVDRVNEKMARATHAKMGYVPTSILKCILYIRQLKSPGDPTYFAHKQNLLQSKRKDRVYLSESFDAAEMAGQLNTSHHSGGTDRSGSRIHSQGIGLVEEDSPLSVYRKSRRSSKTILDFRGLDDLSAASPFTPRARSLSNSHSPHLLPPVPPVESRDVQKQSLSHVESVGLSSIALLPDDSH